MPTLIKVKYLAWIIGAVICLIILLHEVVRDRGIIEVTAQAKDAGATLDGVILLRNSDWRREVSNVTIYLRPASLSEALGNLETADGVVTEVVYGDHNQFREIQIRIKPSVMKARSEYRIVFRWQRRQETTMPTKGIADIQGYVNYLGAWLWGKVASGQRHNVWFTLSSK